MTAKTKQRHSQGTKDAEGHTVGCVACPECQRERFVAHREEALDDGSCLYCFGAGVGWAYNARSYEMVQFVTGPAQVTDDRGTRSLVTCICVRRGE